jgi:hypothetical protein
MKTARIWLIRILIIALLIAAVIKSPTAFVAALLGVILAGYLLFLWLKWKFWRIISPLTEMGRMTNEVTLTLLKSNRPFHNPEKVNADIATLKQNGFTILGTYTAKQLPTTNIVVANNQSENIHAIIMDMEYQPVITEFCSWYENGATFTCSNTIMPAFLPRPDNHPISRLPKSDAQTVLNQFKATRPAATLCQIPDAEVVSQIEALYNEIKVYEVETIENTTSTEAQLLENFIIKSGWSAIEWHRKQNNIVIIHDKIKDYELISKYEEIVDDEDEQYQKRKGRAESIIKNNTPINAFKILITEIPTKQRLEKILELTEPIPAHVYLKKSAP